MINQSGGRHKSSVTTSDISIAAIPEKKNWHLMKSSMYRNGISNWPILRRILIYAFFDAGKVRYANSASCIHRLKVLTGRK